MPQLCPYEDQGSFNGFWYVGGDVKEWNCGYAGTGGSGPKPAFGNPMDCENGICTGDWVPMFTPMSGYFQFGRGFIEIPDFVYDIILKLVGELLKKKHTVPMNYGSLMHTGLARRIPASCGFACGTDAIDATLETATVEYRNHLGRMRYAKLCRYQTKATKKADPKLRMCVGAQTVKPKKKCPDATLILVLDYHHILEYRGHYYHVIAGR